MLRLSDEQMAALGADARERYEGRLADEMRLAHPECDDAEVEARVAERVEAAVAAGVADEAMVTRYVRMTFTLSPLPAPPIAPAHTRTKQRQDPATKSSRRVGSAVQSCLGWIAIEVLDDRDRPAAHRAFSVELPDGSFRRGLTDGSGRALLVSVPNGTCNVSFPNASVQRR